MSVNYTVIIMMWVLGILSFIFVIPKNRHRRVLIAFLINQALLWVSSLIHVEFQLIAFPVREFPKATDLLLTTEFFFYPMLAAFYVIYEPKRSFSVRLIYSFIWTSVIVIIDHLLVAYTDLVMYTNYTWYLAWLSFFSLLAITNVIYQWYFKKKEHLRMDREAAK